MSIVVPTYREARNVPQLIERIERVARDADLSVELLIVDDDSRDGTEAIVASMGRPWVRLLVRAGGRDLSQAVVEGLRQARHDVLVVMDADLSHPPEAIPHLLEALGEGADFVVASRYVDGGGTDEAWTLWRALNSRAAKLLARPFTAIADPMSGFFCLRRETFARAAPLRPIGYKIGLELLVKCRCRSVREIPIHFATRRLGRSKLSPREQLKYLRHLWRLTVYTYRSRHRPPPAEGPPAGGAPPPHAGRGAW